MTLRSQTDPDQTRVVSGPTDQRMALNQHEVHCGMCGKISFVDEETLHQINRAINAGLDNPFSCSDCVEEYDDLAFEG
jgi:hypothetical protein